ncbi:MAG: hypothetical protein JW860_03420 [Sedimentisphaerales bacterium]|nr:hypothetical protein [Sedimentisphaerales bacterium]
MTAPLKKALKIVSFTGLVLSVVPAFLVFGGIITKQLYLEIMFLGMVLWFSTAIFWIKKDHLDL